MSSAYLQASVSRRVSLPLTADDISGLAAVQADPALQRAMADLGHPVAGNAKETVWVHAVFAAGLRAIQERAEEAAYAQWAADNGGHS